MLSKTFQDAVVLTRALRIRYLWVDSLCIIQHDLDDWERESAKVSSVYANGALAIAATHVKDGSDGLFLDANETRVSGMTPLKEPYVLYFRRLAIHQSGGVMEGGRGGSSTRFRRGGVFRKRLLSPLILHFGGDELFFECNPAAWCDCGSKRNRKLLKTEYTKLIFCYHDLDYDPQFRYPDYNHVAVVDDCNVILSGHDEFGRVEGKTLTICGPLATG